MKIFETLKSFMHATMAFMLASTDAVCITFALIPHGFLAYSIALLSFVVLSTFFYWYDLQTMCHFYMQTFWTFCTVPGHLLKDDVMCTNGVYHLSKEHWGMRSACDKNSTKVRVSHDVASDGNNESPVSISDLKGKLFVSLEDHYPSHQLLWISGAIVLLACVCAFAFVVLNYAGMAVFIYNTLLSNFTFHSGMAYVTANVFAVPSACMLFGMMFQEFFMICFTIVQCLPGALQYCQDKAASIFVQSPNSHEAFQFLRHLLVIFVAFFISHVTSRLLIYGFKRYCVAIANFSVAPLVPSWLAYGICFIIGLTLLRSLYRIFDFSVRLITSKNPRSLLGCFNAFQKVPQFFQYTLVMFLGLVRVCVQAITAQTFVRGHAFLGSSAFAGALNEARDLVDRWIPGCDDTSAVKNPISNEIKI